MRGHPTALARASASEKRGPTCRHCQKPTKTRIGHFLLGELVADGLKIGDVAERATHLGDGDRTGTIGVQIVEQGLALMRIQGHLHGQARSHEVRVRHRGRPLFGQRSAELRSPGWRNATVLGKVPGEISARDHAFALRVERLEVVGPDSGLLRCGRRRDCAQHRPLQAAARREGAQGLEDFVTQRLQLLRLVVDKPHVAMGRERSRPPRGVYLQQLGDEVLCGTADALPSHWMHGIDPLPDFRGGGMVVTAQEGQLAI
mmetsp:Transcript_36298/g.104453  ORF Transcript_36298/g.104453 Transcript_36298/m.104453 type:complete len:259 (+) Transcript_36298:437-1213(+)